MNFKFGIQQENIFLADQSMMTMVAILTNTKAYISSNINISGALTNMILPTRIPERYLFSEYRKNKGTEV